MVNIFLIHSGKNKAEVDKIAQELIAMNPNANPLALGNASRFWKKEADGKIRRSQIVLFIVGSESHKSKNIDWELKRAMKYNKVIYYYLLDSENKLNEVLRQKDRFSNTVSIQATKLDNLQTISDRITRYENGDYTVLNAAIDDLNENQLFDQYKIFLQTSETLVARRQNISNFYISINAALITVSTFFSTIASDYYQRFIIVIAVALIGIILCYSWNNVLESYGMLNASKMKVISILEKNLPARLYDSEWEVMSDKLNNRKYKSFTSSEKIIPIIFASVYSLAIIIILVITFFELKSRGYF